jgi:hypothetical protein
MRFAQFYCKRILLQTKLSPNPHAFTSLDTRHQRFVGLATAPNRREPPSNVNCCIISSKNACEFGCIPMLRGGRSLRLFSLAHPRSVKNIFVPFLWPRRRNSWAFLGDSARRLAEEPVKLSAGGIERILLRLGVTAMDQRTTFVIDHIAENLPDVFPS